ncbi:MAG: glycosyltransferase family A protein [bacterium]
MGLTRTDPPLLSVLVLNYNYARFLPQCLDSILSQTFEDFELIVIDDCSTDESREALNRYAGRPRVTVVNHETNQGWVKSLIEGTEQRSRGEFLSVVSADDFALEPTAFARQLAAIRTEPGVVACVTAFLKLGPGAERAERHPLRGEDVLDGHEFIRRQLCDREAGLLHSGTIIRASAYRAGGGYRAGLSNYLDLAMWLDLGYQGSVAYLDEPFYAYRIHDSQLSGSAARRRLVLREGIDLLRSAAAKASANGIPVTEAGVLRVRIADLALADAFANRRIGGLLRCWDALLLQPRAAFTSSGWWLALIRSLAGRGGWRVLVRVRRFLP